MLSDEQASLFNFSSELGNMMDQMRSFQFMFYWLSQIAKIYDPLTKTIKNVENIEMKDDKNLNIYETDNKGHIAAI